jgi:nucleotide-binding universal stress UspA family protein
MLERILVPLDRSALAERAIGQAMLIARGAGASIDLVLVHTPFPFAGFSGKRWDETEWKVEHDYLEAVARDVQSCSSRPVTHAVMRGAATEKICERATDADLIVMTSHGRTGLSRAWLGSVADGVVHRTSVPVLVLRAERPTQPRGMAHHGFKRILVPIDGSELAGEALGPAIELAKAVGASITLFRAVHPIPLIAAYDVTLPLTFQPMVVDADATEHALARVKGELATIAEQLRHAHGLDVDFGVAADARSADAIVEFARARAIDCIAMSTHGRGASRLVIGSVADKVLRGSGLPVLLRHPVGVVESYLNPEEVEDQLPALAGSK